VELRCIREIPDYCGAVDQISLTVDYHSEAR
jgi:hypothetical protein